MIRSRWLLAVSIAGFGSTLVWAVAAQTGGNPAQQPETSQIPPFRPTQIWFCWMWWCGTKASRSRGCGSRSSRCWKTGSRRRSPSSRSIRRRRCRSQRRRRPLPPHVFANFPRYRITSAANVLLLDALNTPLNDQTTRGADAEVSAHDSRRDADRGLHTGVAAANDSGFTTNVAMIEEALNLGRTPAQKSLMNRSLGRPGREAGRCGDGRGDPGDDSEVNDFRQDRQTFQTEQRVDITLGAFP